MTAAGGFVVVGAALLWLLRGKSGPGWRVLSWSTLLRSGWSSRWCRLCLDTSPSWRLLEEFPLLRASPPCCSHLEIWTSPSPSCLSVLRCLGVASGVRRIRDACFAWFNSGCMFYERLMANFAYFLRVVNSDPRRLLSSLTEWSSVHS